MDDMDIPKNSKRRSQVWNHFQIMNAEKASCNCCGAHLHFRGSTFNLKRHLENKHKDIPLTQTLKIKRAKHDIKYEKIDSEDSFLWADGDGKTENEDHIEETQDILVDISDHSTANEIIDSNGQVRVVSFDFQERKNQTENGIGHGKNQTIQDFNVEIQRLTPLPKKKIRRTELEMNEDNEFRETQIFGNFVASQLRILTKRKREKLQILIQRAILDAVCEESTAQEAYVNFS